MRSVCAVRRAHLPSFRLCMRDDSGATLVEFAVSVIILLTLIFGVIESAFAFYTFNVVSEAAREATRYAMVRGSTLSTDCTKPGLATCIAQTGDIQTYVRNLGFPGINSSNLSATTTWLTSTGGSCGTSDTCKAPGNNVKVTVSYQFPWSIPFVPQRTLSMSNTSQMVISQ